MTDRRLRAVLVLVGIGAATFGIVFPLAARPAAAKYIALDVSLGLAFVLAGALAWARRPGNRTGILMMATGLVWFCRYFYFARAPWSDLVGDLALNLTLALVAYQFLVFPHGRARTTFERGLGVAIFATAVGGYLLPRVFFDPVVERCYGCRRNLLLLDGSHAAFTVTLRLTTACSIGLGVVILVRLFVRWWRASAPGKRVLTPIVCAAPLVAVVVVATLVNNGVAVGSLFSFGDGGVVLQWSVLVYVAIPLAFLVGLLRTRLHRTALGSLVVELSESPPPDQVQAALARALGDPSLQVAYRASELGGYVDADGAPVELPHDDDPDRAVSVLEQGGEPVAALVYDPSLLDDEAFVNAAAAAARLALENARLQAELRAQLVAVRASRARIVEAGDTERRRLERDLHDGAQQRLLGIRLALQLARNHAGDSREVEELLSEAEHELEGTLEELRALARGIHPVVLTDEGLASALETLARRSSVPVEIESLPTARFPAQVEAAAYFVASEALANVAKHARASHVDLAVARHDGRVVIDIADDGVGGADPRGHGLVGLLDRVEALDGKLQIESPDGGGTRLHAEIPCA
jgi:signal transduction histidine kinase